MPWGRGPGWVPRARPAGGWDRPWAPGRGVVRQPPAELFARRVSAELDQSAAVTLNGTGAGFVMLGPDGGAVWRVRQVHVGTGTGPTDAAACFLYRTAVLPHRQLGETSQGGGDTFSFDVLLRQGDVLVALWSGGQAADVATLNLSGRVYALVA